MPSHVNTHPRPTATAAPVAAPRLAGAEPGARSRPLSTAALRVNDVLGLPMTALPGIEAEDPVYVREHSRALNELIEGRPAPCAASELLAGHLAAAGWEQSAASVPPSFPGLWSRDDVRALDAGGLVVQETEWRRRMAGGAWSPVAATLRDEVDFEAAWRDILGGDFDATGRGSEYTRGMEVFQASRWLGARTLLGLIGARGGGVYLDVLGGDGYVWRLLQAERAAAAPRLALVRHPALPAGGFVGGEIPARLAAAAAEVHAGDPGAWVLAVGDADASGVAPSVLLRSDGSVLGASPTLPLSRESLGRLAGLPGAAWHEPGTEFRAPTAFGDALVVTNDVSPHMFTRAGAWGFPTREDARRLSRSFRDAAFDGVLFAYGTHHIDDIGAALREGFTVMKPGGTVVVHDFLDEGPAGEWFHRVVDGRSKTGHDFPHIGPVQMAAHLLRAGFRDVRLHEIQDPFLFVCDPGQGRARELALGYIMGMYGLEQGFPGGLGELEGEVREILTYPEVGELPVFGADYVYIPRRAVVAVGRRPGVGEAERSEGDRALIRTCADLFSRDPGELAEALDVPESVGRYWFARNGRHWGIPPEERADFLAWAETV
ncbi:MAG TPA: methyltransferase domain-containing protein [Longimicrobium sp.]|nr:methyltransferase domain-containing protein [Longimicrobium sp.]